MTLKLKRAITLGLVTVGLSCLPGVANESYPIGLISESGYSRFTQARITNLTSYHDRRVKFPAIEYEGTVQDPSTGIIYERNLRLNLNNSTQDDLRGQFIEKGNGEICYGNFRGLSAATTESYVIVWTYWSKRGFNRQSGCSIAGQKFTTNMQRFHQ